MDKDFVALVCAMLGYLDVAVEDLKDLRARKDMLAHEAYVRDEVAYKERISVYLTLLRMVGSVRVVAGVHRLNVVRSDYQATLTAREVSVVR